MFFVLFLTYFRYVFSPANSFPGPFQIKDKPGKFLFFLNKAKFQKWDQIINMYRLLIRYFLKFFFYSFYVFFYIFFFLGPNPNAKGWLVKHGCVFWYLGKSDLSSVHVYSNIHTVLKIDHQVVLGGTKKIMKDRLEPISRAIRIDYFKNRTTYRGA